MKEKFAAVWNTFCLPWRAFRKKSPLASFITGRILTMIVLLFLLGLALFALMDLAPGDIVDQMMSQQIMSSVEGGKNGSGNNAKGENNFSDEQMSLLRAEFGLDRKSVV